MRYRLPNGQTIAEGMPFVFDDIQYPENWLRLSTQEERNRLGLVEAIDTERKDERFYNHVENEDGTLTITPKPLEDGEPYVDLRGVERRPQGLKSFWITQVKTTAGSLLAQSDWKITRAAEGVKPVDPETLAYRASVRAYSNMVETEIMACTTVEALVAIVTALDWPDQGGV